LIEYNGKIFYRPGLPLLYKFNPWQEGY